MTFELTYNMSRGRAWVIDNRQRLRRIGLALAISWFSAGLVWALWALPDTVDFVLWPLAVMLLAGVPLMTALNAAEFHLMSRVAGTHIGCSESLETTIYASAANMLPIPGAVIARIAALKMRGTTIRASSAITALFAGIWGAVAFCYVGIWFLVIGQEASGAAFTTTGVCLLGICFLATIKLRAQRSLLGQAVAIRFAATVLGIVRQMLAIWSLGVAINFGEASVFAISGFFGNAMSIVPAGLGLREFVVAAAAHLIALPAAVGFLSAVIIRIVDMVGLAALAAILVIGKRNAP